VTSCEHLICDIIGGACSLASGRSRGCHPTLAEKQLDPAVLDEVRDLVAAIDPEARDARTREAAARLAAVVRQEALEDRNLVALVATDDPDLAPALVRLCFRRR